jgi:two-component system response regulator HydG
MARKGIHPDLENFMLHYTWPGNVRELKNFIERLAVLSDGDTLYYRDSDLNSARMDLNALLDKNEKEILTRVITITGGDREKMSRLLNISVKEIKERMQRHDL